MNKIIYSCLFLIFVFNQVMTFGIRTVKHGEATESDVFDCLRSHHESNFDMELAERFGKLSRGYFNNCSFNETHIIEFKQKVDGDLKKCFIDYSKEETNAKNSINLKSLESTTRNRMDDCMVKVYNFWKPQVIEKVVATMPCVLKYHKVEKESDSEISKYREYLKNTQFCVIRDGKLIENESKKID